MCVAPGSVFSNILMIEFNDEMRNHQQFKDWLHDNVIGDSTEYKLVATKLAKFENMHNGAVGLQFATYTYTASQTGAAATLWFPGHDNDLDVILFGT